MNTLRYFKKMKPDGKRIEVSYDEALSSLRGTFRYNDMTRDMLTIPNNIDCRYAWIYVEQETEHGNMCLMPGIWNDLPAEYSYDDNGNRIAD